MKKQNITVIRIFLAIASFELLPQMQAVTPPPDGCYPGFTTAEGCDALNSLTTGSANTALGWRSLLSNSTGSFNTAVGAGALVLNNGDSNIAVGAAALLLNTIGTHNVAMGTAALLNNVDGTGNNAFGDSALQENTHASDNTAIGNSALFNNDATDTGEAEFNTAIGSLALFSNTDGHSNTATGAMALQSNTVGINNTATGASALQANTAGSLNTAIGHVALSSNTTGTGNTAVGFDALPNSTGSSNTAIGRNAGLNATTGIGNVYVGQGVDGIAAESNHTYIRNINTTTVSGGGTDTVTVNLSTGLLGHLSSSRRYKEQIQPMDATSETLYRLQPVTFRYKKEIDASQSLEYGLIAEDVAGIDPNLANRNRDGQIESVRYHAINAMLLNEFLKAHRTVQELTATVTEQKKQIAALTAGLQKVSAQVELNQSTTRAACNNE